MPLPADFLGVFYDKETGAEMLYDLTIPEILIVITTAIKSGQPGSVQFYIAGAVHDLLGNDYSDQAKIDGLLAYGRQIAPDCPWDILIEASKKFNEVRKLVGEHPGDDLGQVVIQLLASVTQSGIAEDFQG